MSVSQLLPLQINTFFVNRKDVKDIILSWVIFTLTFSSYSCVSVENFTYYCVLATCNLTTSFENLFSCCFVDNDIGYAINRAFGEKKPVKIKS